MSTVRDFLRTKGIASREAQMRSGLRLVDASVPVRRKAIEAGDILPAVRAQIHYDFHFGLKSSRKLAKKYKLSRVVVQDIILLCTRIEPQSARLSFVDMHRRMA